MIKGDANNGRNPPSRPFLNLTIPFPDIEFINEEAIGAMNEAAIGAIITPRNLPSCSSI